MMLLNNDNENVAISVLLVLCLFGSEIWCWIQIPYDNENLNFQKCLKKKKLDL